MEMLINRLIIFRKSPLLQLLHSLIAMTIPGSLGSFVFFQQYFRHIYWFWHYALACIFRCFIFLKCITSSLFNNLFTCVTPLSVTMVRQIYPISVLPPDCSLTCLPVLPLCQSPWSQTDLSNLSILEVNGLVLRWFPKRKLVFSSFNLT